MVQCDRNAKKARIQREEDHKQNSELAESNYGITMDSATNHRSLMQLVNVKDAEMKEREHAERKFGDLWRCVDITAQNVFTGGVRSSVLKASCGCNHWETRENFFNSEREKRYPRCMNDES